MAGASTSHNRVVVNVLGELRFALKVTPSEPFASDMKVLVDDIFLFRCFSGLSSQR